MVESVSKMAGSIGCFSEGAWCPPGHKLSDCELVFIGDSLFRYLAQQIPSQINDIVPAVYFRSGAKVEDLFGGHVSNMISQKTRVCVVHVGTNDLKDSSKSVPTVLEQFKVMLVDLHKTKPEFEIFISSILPRGLNLWERNASFPIMSQRTEQLNRKVAKFNQLLWEFTLTQSYLHFVNNDVEFWPSGQGVQAHLLAQDGLHMSKKGVCTLAETLVSEVEAFQLNARSQSLFRETESQVCSLEHQDDYPPLPQSVCVGGTDSPYVISDPSLIVTKTDLCKVSAWAMLQRVSQRKQKVSTTVGKTKHCI